MNQRLMPFYAWIGCCLALLIAACGQQRQETAEEADTTVHSFLEGRFTVSADVDSVPDYHGFEVLVALHSDGEPDTLGYGETDSTGAFQFEVTAPTRGVYALIVSRHGQILKIDDLAVADSDSAKVQATFPIGNRLLRIRSLENASWMAYKNTKAQHSRNLLALVQSGQYSNDEVQLRVEQTASILWKMKTTFPNTMGGEVAEAEAVAMLGGWNDSLALAWAEAVPPENVSYGEVARVARQASARLYGQDAALQMLHTYQERAITDDQRALIQSEIVLAYNDSLQYDEAVAAAHTLATTYPGTQWATWADRAVYELEHLRPGMPAPSWTATTNEGDTVVLDSLRGTYVILEFYRPQDQSYQRELEMRNALYEAADAALRFVSVSVEPDTLLNEAFLEGRTVHGLHVFAPGGLDGDLARLYNINVTPTRYLIDPEGNIVGKYVGSAMAALQTNMMDLLSHS